MQQISDFLVTIKNEKTELFVKNTKSSFKKINKLKKFMFGYIYRDKKLLKGEYLLIDKKKSSIEIINDKFGTYPLFIKTNKNNEIIISNSVKWINRIDTVSINLDKLYEYFMWGYLPCTKESIYKDIKTINPNSKIKIIKNKLKIYKHNYKIFYIKKGKFSVSNYLNLFDKEIKKIGKFIQTDKLYIGLTSGNDSLLGSLLIKKSLKKHKFFTATFGNINSNEVKRANARSVKIFSKINFVLKESKIYPSIEEIKKISDRLSGLSTIACFPQYKFHSSMAKKNKKFFFDFSLFEFLRKKIKNKKDLKKKYTTPPDVVNEYFKNIPLSNLVLNQSLARLDKVYGRCMIEKFYLYDRAVKNQFYKSVFLNDHKMSKIAIIHNSNILNYNLNYLKKNKNFPFWEIYKKLVKNDKFYLDEMNKLKKYKPKNLPFIYENFCLKYRLFFIKVLKKELNGEIDKLFNIKKIIYFLKIKKIKKNHHWFFLRFLNFIIFKNENNLKI